MSKPYVSLIIPVYNGADTLRQSLEAVTNLHYDRDKLEIIVVDNNSTDDSPNIAVQYPIRVVHAEIRNRSFARNTGVRFSSGEILCFIDCDCVPDPSWLSTLVEQINTSTGGVQGMIVPRGGNPLSYEAFSHAHLGHPFIDTKGCLIPRHVWNTVGPFDENLSRCEDIDLGWRIHEAGYTLVFSDAAVISCGVPRGVAHTLFRAWESSRGMLQVHSKWRYRKKLSLFVVLKGFFIIGMRNHVRRGGRAGLPLSVRLLYLGDDLLTGIFYIFRYCFRAF